MRSASAFSVRPGEMRRRKLCLLAAVGVGLALTTSPATAEPETGRRISSTPSAVRNMPVDKAAAGRIVLNQYSRCYAKQNSSRAKAALELPYLSREQDDAVRKLNRGLPDCLGFSGLHLRFTAPAMVGGMAEEFVLSRYGGDDLLQVTALTEEAMFASSFKPRNDGEDFAQCVARSNVTGAYAILQTTVASDAETAALKALAPVLGSCLVAGSNLNLNSDTVRSISAVGLYRILSGMVPADAGK